MSLTDDAASPQPQAEPEGSAEAPRVLVLPPSVEEQRNVSDGSLGFPGRPFDRHSPFFIGLTGALGVAVAYLFIRGLGDVASVLVLIGIALFVAIGLNPVIDWLASHGCSRGVSTAIVTLVFLGVIAGFVAAALPPITHEVQQLTKNYPRYRSDLIHGRGLIGHLAVRLHLTSYLQGKQLKIPFAGGLLGAGRALLAASVATVSVVCLTIYFLIALPEVRRLYLSLIPRSRRDRVASLSDEVFDRVGGFMLGNLVTSFISGLGTFIWLAAFGVPYPLLLGLFVAIFDLIPMVGSTIAGVVVTLVAATRSVPIGIATAVFYVGYRFLEDYLLNPRVMKHTVRVSPGLTIVATLIGASLLGLIGALVAIPVAATIHLLLEEIAVPRQNLR